MVSSSSRLGGVLCLTMLVPTGRSGEVTATIVDSQTGAVIPNAVMYIVEERSQPLTGIFWSTASMESDGEGMIRVSAKALPKEQVWWFIEAQGYAPQVTLARQPDSRIELSPGRDVTIRLIDVLDQPVAGATIGWTLGCGHAPDSRWGLTDEAGRVELRGIDPNCEAVWWPSGPGILADDTNVEWNADRTEATLRCDPAPTQEGVVLDADGELIAGVYVGQPNRHRGPWCRTDSNGRFRLYGGTQSELWVRSEEGGDMGIYPRAAAGFSRRIFVGRERTAGAKLALQLLIDLEPPSVPVLVQAVREDDGWNAEMRADTDGRVVFDLEPGRYRLRVGSAMGAIEPLVRSVELSRDHPLSLELKLDRRPFVRILSSGLPPNARVFLATAATQREVTRELESVCLPRAPCVFRVITPEGTRTRRVLDADRSPGAIIALSP